MMISDDGNRKRKSIVTSSAKSTKVKTNALLFRIKSEFELHKKDNAHMKKEVIDIDDTSDTANGPKDFFDDEFSTIYND